MTAVGRAGTGRRAAYDAAAEIVRGDRSGGPDDDARLPDLVFPDRIATPAEIADLEAELASIVADVLLEEATVAA